MRAAAQGKFRDAARIAREGAKMMVTGAGKGNTKDQAKGNADAEG